MQYLHPMQRLESTRTTPSSVAKVAPTGQTWTHGGFSHWLQSFGTKKLLRTSLSSPPGFPFSSAPEQTSPTQYTSLCQCPFRRGDWLDHTFRSRVLPGHPSEGAETLQR